MALRFIPPPNKSESYSRYPWFNNRLTKIAEIGQLQLDSPEIENIAIGYITQVAKNLAVSKSQELLRKVSTFAGITNPTMIDGYLKSLEIPVRQIRAHQAFIARGLATLNETKNKANFGDQQAQLLLDLAFIRNRAFDQPKEFRETLEPLIRFVGEGDWEGAYKHRDFLLRYFADSFPDWRVKRFEQEQQQSSYLSFRDLTKAIVEHRLTLDPEDIPTKYKEAFGDIFPKKIERAERTKDSEIIRYSFSLSKEIVKEVSKASKTKSFATLIRREYGQNAGRIIIMFEGIADEEDQKQAFMEFMECFNPDLPYLAAEEKYLQLKANFKNIRRRPYIVRIPNPREILEVEARDNDQVYWYPTRSPRSFRDQKGRIQELYKYYSSFGRFLHDLILSAYNENPEKQTLNLTELENAFIAAYQIEKEQYPKLFYRLSEYIKAHINNSHLNVELTEEDSILKFINQLDTKA